MSIDQDSMSVDSAEGTPDLAADRAPATASSPFKRSSKKRPYWSKSAEGESPEPDDADLAGVLPGQETNSMSVADAPTRGSLRDALRRNSNRVGQRPIEPGFGGSDDIDALPNSLDHLAEFAPPPMRSMQADPAHSNPPTLAAPSMALAPLSYDYGTTGQAVTRKEYVTTQYIRAAAVANTLGHKPLHKRLTPLSWVMISMGAAAIISGAVFASRFMTSQSVENAPAVKFGQSVAAERQASQSTPVENIAATAVPQASPTSAPVATQTKAQATQMPQPTVLPTQAVLAPTSVPTAEPTPEQQAVAQPTADAAAQPAPVATADVVPWAGSMTQPSAGLFMAPENIVAETRQGVVGYYESLRQHKTVNDATRDLVDGQDTFLGQYFEGLALAQMKQQINDASGLGVWEKGDVTVNILSYSPDGTAADAVISQRGITSKIYEKPRLVFWTQRRLPDQDVRVRLRFSLSDNRWRVSEVVETVAVKRTRTPALGTQAPAPRARRVVPSKAPAAPVAPAPDTSAPAEETQVSESSTEPAVELPAGTGSAIPPAP